MSAPHWTNGASTLWHGDARRMDFLADQSVHTVVTSPPYFGMRDYELAHAGGIGLENSLGEWVQNVLDVMREVRRVLRDDGVAWLNLGDGYAGSGKGMLKNGTHSDGPKQATNRGSIGLPPLVVSKRVPRGPGSGRWGMGDRAVTGLARKNLLGMAWRVAFALQNDGIQQQAEVRAIERAIAALDDAYDGDMPDRARAALAGLLDAYYEARGDAWILRSAVVWHKPNTYTQSVKDRPSGTYEMLFMLVKRPRYFYDNEAVMTPFKDPDDYLRRLRREKRRTRDEFMAELRHRPDAELPKGANLRNVWLIPNRRNPVGHKAAFPVDLPEICIKAATSAGGVCQECGTQYRRGETDPETGQVDWRAGCRCQSGTVPALVLDPFVGSGTTLVAAAELGRRGVGVDLNTEYLDGAAQRIEKLPVPLITGGI